MNDANCITVDFGAGFSGHDTGPFLLEVERLARHMLTREAEVFMRRKGDDSKLRNLMTPDERAKL